MRKYVIDASVVLKALLNENKRVELSFARFLEKAAHGTIEILSSKLLLLEVANGMRFSLANKELALRIYKDFLKLPIKFLGLTKSQIKKSLNFSYNLNSSVYDTSYHILAKAHGATFLTCDKEYFEKAKEYGDIDYLE